MNTRINAPLFRAAPLSGAARSGCRRNRGERSAGLHRENQNCRAWVPWQPFDEGDICLCMSRIAVNVANQRRTYCNDRHADKNPLDGESWHLSPLLPAPAVRGSFGP